jgi:hypothetical protein
VSCVNLTPHSLFKDVVAQGHFNNLQVCSTIIKLISSIQSRHNSIPLFYSIMICEKCSRALQHAIKQCNSVEPEKSSSGEQSMPQKLEPYRNDRCDLLKKAANACWVCSRLRRYLASRNISSFLVDGTYSLPFKWVCNQMLLDVRNSDFALAYIDVGMESSEGDTCEIEVNIMRSYGTESRQLSMYH